MPHAAICVVRSSGPATARANARLAASGCKRHGSAGEPVAVNASEHQVRVGDGRVLATAAVAGRPRIRTRAPRPHRDLAELVDASHRAAARPDLDHLDHRNPQRQSASPEKTGGAVDLETPRRVRGEPVDQADLRGGATHVEGDDLLVGALGCDPAGQHRAARRPRFDQPDRETRSGLECHQTSA